MKNNAFNYDIGRKLFLCAVWKLRYPRKEKKEGRVNKPPPQGDKLGICNGIFTSLQFNMRNNQWKNQKVKFRVYT